MKILCMIRITEYRPRYWRWLIILPARTKAHPIFNFDSGIWYYRIRTWTGEAGSGGMPSDWSQPSVTININVQQTVRRCAEFQWAGYCRRPYTLNWDAVDGAVSTKSRFLKTLISAPITLIWAVDNSLTCCAG